MLPIRDDSTSINVRWFGADPTGAVDATAAIQATLNYAATFSTGRAVYIPRGIYQITNSLIIGSNTCVYGDGIGQTVLRGKAGTYAGINVNGTLVQATLGAAAKNHVTVEQLTIDHQTNSTSANGIELVPDGNFAGTVCTDCIVQNCEVLLFNVHEYGIWSMRGQRIVVQNNFVDGAVVVFGGSSQEGIEIFGGSNVVVAGNVVRRIGAAGIAIGASFPIVLNSGLDGINCYGNVVDSCFNGITLYTASNSPANPQNLSDVIVAENVVRNCNQHGIYLTLAFSGTTVNGAKITNNTVSNCPVGIRTSGFLAAESHHGIQISGNTVRDAANVLLGGIYVELLTNVVINDNIVDNPTHDGLRLASLTNARVTGNQITRVGNEGIRGDGLVDTEISSNRLDTITAGAIHMETCTRVAVDRNYLNNWAAANLGIFVDGSTFSTIIDNELRRPAAVGGFDAGFAGGCNACVLADNRFLYAPGANPITNLGANPNFGTIAPGGGAASVAVANTTATNAVNLNAHINIWQIAGPPNATTVVRTATGFQVNFAAAAAGTEQYQWEIRA